MLDLEQCPFCNGKLEIVTLNCSSGGTPCYCFRCTKCGGIRRFGTLNPADICRECELSGNPKLAKAVEMLDRFDNLLQKEINKNAELSQKVRLLEQAGDRIVKLVNEVYTMCGGPCILQDAVKEWESTKEEAE